MEAKHVQETHESKAPWLHLTKRQDPLPLWRAWSIRGIGLLVALFLCAILIYLIIHMNPARVYSSLLDGAFGSSKKTWVTVRDAMTLLCIAIGLAPAFKMKFWNIGAEGQVLVGAIATVACMRYLQVFSPFLLLLVMFLASALAGALWGLLPAFFKAKWNTNETLFTLMMNYIAMQLTAFFVALWENPPGSNSVGVLNMRTHAGWIPNLFKKGFNADFGWNVVLVLTIAVLMYLYLSRSKHGYEIAVVGDSLNTARYAGIRVDRVIIRTMLLSGGICGIAGFIAVAGASHTISTATAGGRGFTAIIVAWLSRFNAVVMLVFSFLLVILEKGAMQISTQYKLNDNVSNIITGIILFCLLASEFFVNYQLTRRGKEVR